MRLATTFLFALPLLVAHRRPFLLHARLLLRKGLRARVDPRDEPALVRLVDARDARSPEVLGELGEGDPARGVHVHVVLVLDEFLVDAVGVYAGRPESVR